MRRIIFAFVAVAMVFAVAGVSLVGVANASAPGDPLYSVDRQLETLRLGLAGDPQSALHLQVDYAAERVAELQAVTERGDLENFDVAVAAVGEAVTTIESYSAEQNMDPDQVAALLDAALTGEPVPVQGGNDTPGDDGNVNDANVNDANGNDGATNTNTNDNSNTNENTNDGGVNDNTNTAYKHERTGGNCADGGDDSHPAANKLAGTYGVPASEIMDWFCGGYGFGEIALGYNTALKMGVPVNEVFQMRADGMGWGQIMHAYGLKGGGKKVKDNGGGAPVVSPTPGAPANLTTGPGNGNNGNGKGNNGKGNNGNNGNGKGGGKKP